MCFILEEVLRLVTTDNENDHYNYDWYLDTLAISVTHNCHGMTDGPSLSWYESSFHTMKDEAVFVFHTMKAGSWDLI